MKKPRIRKTKEEVIFENEKVFTKKGPVTSTNMLNRTGMPPRQPVQLPPPKVVMKPSTAGQVVRKPLLKKPQKEVTEKLTNMCLNVNQGTSTTVERRIERLHRDTKVVTEKPTTNLKPTGYN